MAVLMKADPMSRQIYMGAVKKYKRDIASPFWKWVYSMQDKFKKTKFKVLPKRKSMPKKHTTKGMNRKDYQKEVDKMNAESGQIKKSDKKVIPINGKQPNIK